ncbi:MAG: type II secretion system GspH family protein [Candidatus Gastranaerophilales bacterium]|nr:type II secretion system GspH family protein [Candidatus Gastranaerophilales bacterium]
MKKFAFTLSEVLIALVIIGVIAAMTVPSLLVSTSNSEFSSSLKKAISGVNQALMLNVALDNTSAHDYSSADELVSEIFEKRMVVMDGVTSFTTDDCDGKIFTTQDGIIFCITNYTSENSTEKGSVCDFYNTTPCVKEDGPNLWIDVNGARNPNKLTTSSKLPKDIYQAQIYAQRVIPYGNVTQQIFYNDERNW